MLAGNLGASADAALKPHALDQGAGGMAVGVAEHAAAGGHVERLSFAPAIEQGAHAAFDITRKCGLELQFALHDHLVGGEARLARLPVDVGGEVAHQSPTGLVGGNRNHPLADPVVLGAGVHAYGAADRSRSAHGELHPGITPVKHLLHQAGEDGSRAHDDAVGLVVEGPAAKLACKHHDHTVESRIGHKKIGALAGGKPRKLLALADVQHTAERGKIEHLDEGTDRAADAVGGVLAHRLVKAHFPLEIVVEGKKGQIGRMTCHALGLGAFF